MPHLSRIFQHQTNSLSISSPNLVNSGPIEKILIGTFANKYRKIKINLTYEEL